MNSFSTKVIQDGVLLIVNNKIPDVFKLSIPNGVYILPYGTSPLTITATALVDIIGDEEYNFYSLNSYKDGNEEGITIPIAKGGTFDYIIVSSPFGSPLFYHTIVALS